ncbi:DNA-binding transcriptional regulator, LysR family [Yoonia tamlensis]|uniref:DNA-binding transcriptional regulator, LysR family n=1 Tax=Yoonia tamlensis TaxID=390270 RepID=A0A1I6FTI7_9RHOB|nr:LysR family transcriptional regulator [Yoonia tamlensis]SFR33262.1 DNA-binding transcriptional regulator, LysR family [Yoonia tamlensis]
MRLNLKQLEAFVWVADMQSFRRAAARLNTTQPNISARIARLESALNTQLMTRDAGSVQLTHKGRELLGHARRVLDATDALVLAADQKQLVSGTLRLGVTEMIVHTWLRDYLRAIKESCPSLTVELTVDLSVQLEAGLAERRLDLALQNGPFQRLISGETGLGSYELIWVAAPQLGLDGMVPIDQLAGHPILTHARNTRLFDEVAAHFAQRRWLDVHLVPSSNLAACMHMCLDGMGIATLPAAMVADEIAKGGLRALRYDWVPAPLDFYARYDAEKAPQVVSRCAQIAARVAQSHDKEK